MEIRRAVSICTFNRINHLGEVLNGVYTTMPNETDVFVCDDGSTDQTHRIVEQYPNVHYFRGPNRGVAFNKNRALWLMQDHHFMCILEDDLMPVENEWFETYEAVSVLTDIHHFCRVEDKIAPEVRPAFTDYLKAALNVTPIYGSSPRGDLTFLTRKVITTVGGFNPEFRGVGFAHGDFSARVVKAGLVSHPNGYVDIIEARDKFKQIGDTSGGRWDVDPERIKKELARNRGVAKKLKKKGEVYVPLRIM